MTITLLLLLGVMFMSYLAFAIEYPRLSPWRATWQGIILESQKVTLTLMSGFFIADTLFPPWPGRDVMLIVLLGALAGEAVLTFVGLKYVQHHNGPVPRRQGTGFVLEEDIYNTREKP